MPLPVLFVLCCYETDEASAVFARLCCSVASSVLETSSHQHHKLQLWGTGSATTACSRHSGSINFLAGVFRWHSSASMSPTGSSTCNAPNVCLRTRRSAAITHLQTTYTRWRLRKRRYDIFRKVVQWFLNRDEHCQVRTKLDKSLTFCVAHTLHLMSMFRTYVIINITLYMYYLCPVTEARYTSLLRGRPTGRITRFVRPSRTGS